MKKPLILIILLLSACTTANTTSNPQEILQNAALQMQNLNAVHVQFSGLMINQNSDNSQSIRFNGNGDVITDLQQYKLITNFTTQASSSGVTTNGINGTVEVFMDQESTFYKTKDLMYPELELQLQKNNSTWYKIPQTNTISSGMQYINPDFYKTKSYNGITEVNGQSSHHLNVALSKEVLPQLSTLTGVTLDAQLWIDTTTFNINRIGWNITSPAPKKSELSLQVDLSKHNKVSPSSAPKDYIDSTSSVETPPINPDAFIEELLKEIE